MKKFVWPGVLLLLVLSVLMIGKAYGQAPTPSDDQVNAIAKQLFCPVCENIPLDVCPTQACAQWRELIREKLAQGWTATQIKQYFVDQYGDRVLGTPPARGLNWLVYILPPIAILSGAFILWRAFQAWRTPARTDDVPVEETRRLTNHGKEDEYIRRLEDELRKR
jgi:cytochrome c-type biogenesis protein CcmH